MGSSAALTLALAVALAGCASWFDDSGVESCSDGTCVCFVADACDMGCRGFDACTMVCEDEAHCEMDCGGADVSCTATCGAYGWCLIDCDDRTCAVSCAETGECTVEHCLADRCSVACGTGTGTRTGDTVTCP